MSGQNVLFRDPTFQGMATIYCSNDLPCVLQYHWDCWEYLKNGNNINIREDEVVNFWQNVFYKNRRHGID